MSGTLRVVALVGPTASGKSEAALALAEALGAEIVSADSRQVYRGLDIGTAKPSPEERRRVRHHLIDVVDPDARFDAARFRTMALDAMRDIANRGRAIVVCGGTGFYVRALLHGLFTGPGADPDLRLAFRERERMFGAGTLHRDLAAVDPATAGRLHERDLVRIVRALEVVRVTGRTISSWQAEHAFGSTEVTPLVIGCARARDELTSRIERRCRAMVDAGLLDEIRDLWARGFGATLPPLDSVGYREMGRVLRAEVDFDTGFADFTRATRRLAKRQRTWWRRDPRVEWFHPDRQRAALMRRVATWLELPCPSPTSTSSSLSPR